MVVKINPIFLCSLLTNDQRLQQGLAIRVVGVYVLLYNWIFRSRSFCFTI